MKKAFIIALFILGIYNASAFAMVQEIFLAEMYSMTPFDDAMNESNGGRPNPNRFHAFIDGNVDFTISNQYMTITEENRK